MKYYVDECCGCATESYPCLGSSCSMRHVPYYICDMCGEDDLTEDMITRIDGEDICDDCRKKLEDDLK